MTAHVRRSADIHVALPPDATMALFTPEGERQWVGDRWDPHYPVASRTVGAGTVFTTRHEARTTLWVMVDHEPRRVRYARVTPEGLAGTVEVSVVSEDATGTDVRVTYDLTALTQHAVDELEGFSAGYDAEIASWGVHIAESLDGP